jgi:AraC family transcriptional activator of tynA and feaB
LRTVFATKEVHPRDRFDYWHSVACREVVEHDALPASRLNFEAQLEVGSVGALDLVAFQSSPLNVEHTSTHISHRVSSDLFFCLLARGGLSIEQDGRKVALKPGQMTLIDPSIPQHFSPIRGV